MEKKISKKKSQELIFYVVVFSLVLITGFLIIKTPIANSQQAVQEDTLTNEMIVRYKSKTSEKEKEKTRKNLRTALRHRIEKFDIDVLKVPEGSMSEKLRQYRANPDVDYAEPNYKAHAFVLTNDVSLSQQWGLFKIEAAGSQISAWDVTTGNPSIKIAILDTGIENTHPDLSGKVAVSANFTDSATISDLFGHGTHVAGIAAAATNNINGVAGAGYNTVLLNGKVLGDDGSGYYSWIAKGIIWAADQGAQVINISLGGPSSSIVLKDAVDYAWNKGSVVVAAAGNFGNSNPQYPGYYQNVIAVGATDNNDVKASFSTYGRWVDVSAPGVNIYSTYKENSYGYLSGTSMATPFAAGISALIWSKGICTTNICVREQLEKTADKINGTGTYWAWGRVNAYKAVSDADPFSTPIPTPTNIIIPTPTDPPMPTPTEIPLDRTRPTVSITYPKNRSNVTRGINIVVNADADDNIGVIKVVFYRNGSQICDISGPTSDKKYICSMYTANTRSKVTYKATAFDTAGNMSSSRVTVTAK